MTFISNECLFFSKFQYHIRLKHNENVSAIPCTSPELVNLYLHSTSVLTSAKTTCMVYQLIFLLGYKETTPLQCWACGQEPHMTDIPYMIVKWTLFLHHDVP